MFRYMKIFFFEKYLICRAMKIKDFCNKSLKIKSWIRSVKWRMFQIIQKVLIYLDQKIVHLNHFECHHVPCETYFFILFYREHLCFCTISFFENTSVSAMERKLHYPKNPLSAPKLKLGGINSDFADQFQGGFTIHIKVNENLKCQFYTKFCTVLERMTFDGEWKFKKTRNFLTVRFNIPRVRYLCLRGLSKKISFFIFESS